MNSKGGNGNSNIFKVGLVRNFSFFYFYFLQLYCSNGISLIGNSGCLPRGKPAAIELRYSTYGACWVFWCLHNPSNSAMDYGIFNVRTDVNACDCTRGCTDTLKEPAMKVTSGRKNPLPRRGIEPATAACRSDALPTDLHPHAVRPLTRTSCLQRTRLSFVSSEGRDKFSRTCSYVKVTQPAPCQSDLVIK